MVKLFFYIVKKIILASLLIYSVNMFFVSLGISIPINLFTLVIVSIFDFSAIICLFLFLLTF